MRQPYDEQGSPIKSTGKARTIYIHQADYDYLAQIGNGYADGLRKAVEAHKELNRCVGEGNCCSCVRCDERGEG